MLNSDLVFHLTRNIGPGVVLLCFIVGAVSLWKRTRRVSALVQLLAASLVFISWGFHRIEVEFAMPLRTSLFARVLSSEEWQITKTVSLLVGIFVFALAYLRY